MSELLVVGVVLGALLLYDFFMTRPMRRAVKDYFGYKFWKR